MLYAFLHKDYYNEDVYVFKSERAARRALASTIINTEADPSNAPGFLTALCLAGFRRGTGVKPKDGKLYRLALDVVEVS